VSESRYRSVVETMSEGVIVQDAQGRIEAWNGRALELFGLTAEEIHGRRVASHDWVTYREDGSRFPVDDFPMVVTGRTGEPARDVVQGVERPDGSVVWLSSNTSAIREGDRVTGVVCTFTDITRRRQAEEAQRVSDERFRQAQKIEAVGQLAGGIAHDFNNLLTAITCNVELLLDATLSADARLEHVLQIRDAATRAATLTQQLLAFGRRQVLQPKPLDLNTAVASVERLLRRVLSVDVRLTTELHPALTPVYADAGQMEQVVMNLVLNARDAMPGGGAIVVRTAPVTLHAALHHRFGVVPAGEYVTLTVKDAGEGMGQDVLARLFEPFFTTKAQGKGTGLGLAMVHGIVLQSNGQIVVETAPGLGTDVTVYLPALRSDAPIVPAPLPRETPQPVGHTVLVVDDEPSVRDVTMRAAGRAGYRVIGASSGDEALALLEQERDHSSLLLLTDIVMPRMNGYDLADQVSVRFSAVRVACMSGFSPEAMAREGVRSSPRRILNKPFTLSALTAFIEAAFATDPVVA
jgi:PAS domain S-box-containing protein